MPHVINGIGTWHWGKRNIHKEMGTCEFCRAFGELSSYDTTLYFVVVFIPIIPLKQERVLKCCPSCRKFRVLKLKEWNETKQRDIAAAVESLQKDSRDPTNVGRALRTLVAYQDEPAFVRLASVVRESGDEHPDVQATLGAGYAFFSRHSDAEACFRASLRGKEDPAVRKDLALCLMKQSRPDEARPLLDHIFKNQAQDGIGLVALLIEAFQSVGKHADALQVIERARQSFPAAASHKDFAKYQKISEKNLHTNKPVASRHLAGPRKRASDQASWRFNAPRFIGAGVGVLVAGGYLMACFSAGKSREVYLVNGLNKSYEVEINGRHQRLAPGLAQPVHLPEGKITTHVVTPGIAVPDQVCTVETPFFTRPFAHKTVVINPDRSAVLVREETQYISKESASDTAQSNPYKLFAGDFCYVLDGIDYPFQAFPERIQMSDKTTRLKKERLFVLDKLAPAPMLVALTKQEGTAKAAEYLKQRVTVEPDRLDFISLLPAFLGPQQTIEFLRTKLDARPVLISWHRMYQELVGRSDPAHDLEAEYRTRLGRDETNPDLMYLLGRTLNDRKESAALFAKASSGEQPCVYAFGALAYDQLVQGEFAEALRLSEIALSKEPQNLSFRQTETQALTGLAKLDRLLQINAAERKAAGYDGELVAEAVRLFVQRGEPQQAASVADNYLKTVPKDETPQWRDYFAAVTAYAQGDAAGYAKKIAHVPGDRWQFESAFCADKLEEAAAVLAKDKSAGAYLHLLVYVAAQRAQKSPLAENELQAAIEGFEKGDRIERQLAKWFKGGGTFQAEEVCDVPMAPQEKRIVLVAMGTKFSQVREPCFRMATRLNQDAHFPFLFLKSCLESPAPSASL